MPHSRHIPLIIFLTACLVSTVGCNEDSPSADDRGSTAYFASRSSNLVHRPDCSTGKSIKLADLVTYGHLTNALAEGRRPCKLCLPRATTQPAQAPKQIRKAHSMASSSNTAEWITAVSTAVGAFAAILVAIIALEKDWILRHLSGPRLRFELEENTGIRTRLGDKGPKVWYFHLLVKNDRPKSPARQCRVLLRKFERKREDGVFEPVEPIPRMQFIWALRWINGMLPQIVDEKRIDFGHLTESELVWKPELYPEIRDCDCTVQPGQTVRYHLRIEAENFVQAEDSVFEVHYKGGWSMEREGILDAVQMRMVPEPRNHSRPLENARRSTLPANPAATPWGQRLTVEQNRVSLSANCSKTVTRR